MSTSLAYEQPAIADYGFVSDCRTAALIDRMGSIDWWCVPRFDSPSVFGRLLDPEAGYFSVRPAEDCSVERRYVGDSLVLCTTFRTASGTLTLTDAGAFRHGARGHDIGNESPSALLRSIEATSGRVEVIVEFAPRMEYGRTEPHLTLVSTLR